MALNKKEEFTLQDQQLADLAKAIAHPARIAIIRVLAERQSCICGEIVEILPLAQSTVSQHLKELKNAGLVKGTLSGPKTCYCLDYEKLSVFENTLKEMFKLVSDNNASCC